MQFDSLFEKLMDEPEWMINRYLYLIWFYLFQCYFQQVNEINYEAKDLNISLCDNSMECIKLVTVNIECICMGQV